MKKFDIFGNSINLLYKGNPSIKSSIGGFASVFACFFLGLLLCGFGWDFFKRINPIVIREIENPKEFPKYNITNKTFNIAVRLEDESGNEISEKDYQSFYIESVMTSYDKINGEWTEIDAGKYELTKCRPEFFENKDEKENNIFEEKKLKDFSCTEFNNNRFGGSWSTNFVSFYTFYVRICNEGKLNPITKKPCNSQKYTTELLSKYVYFSGFYQRAIASPSSYKNGVKKDYFNEYFLLSDSLLKKLYFYFYSVKMNSDYGWLVKDIFTEKVIGFSRKGFDYNMKDPTNPTLSEINIYIDKEVDFYTREYMKVQTLAALVGGMLKIFMTTGHILIGIYNTTTLNAILSSYCIFDESLIEEDNELKNVDKDTIKNVFPKFDFKCSSSNTSGTNKKNSLSINNKLRDLKDINNSYNNEDKTTINNKNDIAVINNQDNENLQNSKSDKQLKSNNFNTISNNSSHRLNLDKDKQNLNFNINYINPDNRELDDDKQDKRKKFKFKSKKRNSKTKISDIELMNNKNTYKTFDKQIKNNCIDNEKKNTNLSLQKDTSLSKLRLLNNNTYDEMKNSKIEINKDTEYRDLAENNISDKTKFEQNSYIKNESLYLDRGLSKKNNTIDTDMKEQEQNDTIKFKEFPKNNANYFDPKIKNYDEEATMFNPCYSLCSLVSTIFCCETKKDKIKRFIIKSLQGEINKKVDIKELIVIQNFNRKYQEKFLTKEQFKYLNNELEYDRNKFLDTYKMN